MSTHVIKEPHEIKIKKSHECQGCGKKLNIGENVISSTYSNNEYIWTFYECNECSNYRNIECSKCKSYNYCIGENYEIGLIKGCKEECFN